MLTKDFTEHPLNSTSEVASPKDLRSKTMEYVIAAEGAAGEAGVMYAALALVCELRALRLALTGVRQGSPKGLDDLAEKLEGIDQAIERLPR